MLFPGGVPCVARFAVIAVLLASLAFSGSATADACSSLYPSDGSWAIEACPSDPSVTTPMAVTLDGVARGNFALVRISHRSGNGTMPQVAVIYSSGYVRLKQNADPQPAIPFGSSFILGPAYWNAAGAYFHNPQLSTLSLKTNQLPSLLTLAARGRNGALGIRYSLNLPAPSDARTTLQVTQTATARTTVVVNTARADQHEGYKTAAQISSMFINEGATCAGGALFDCHDSNTARFVGNDGLTRRVRFKALAPPSFIFRQTRPLGAQWLDALHTDNSGWQGNTPNVRVLLDSLPTDPARTITPQGHIAPTDDPNDDNVGLWLQDDYRAGNGLLVGQSVTLGYRLLAQDNPF
jgi:hypothetical protein